jgi:arylsulfatase A-like enzyme
METVSKNEMEDNTIFVFWSDHGDMMGSHGLSRKQHPWDESILVPFLLRYPPIGKESKEIPAPINAVDMMPTLLGLCGAKIPETVEGNDFSDCLKGKAEAPADAALLACYHNFSEFIPGYNYRGVRTERHTYVIKHDGPCALFDNKEDPYQMKNLVNLPEYAELQAELAGKLEKLLKKTNDEFETGKDYIKRWEYTVTEHGHVPYTN